MIKLHSFWLVASLALFVSCNRPIITEATLEVAPQTVKCGVGVGGVFMPPPSDPAQTYDCLNVRKDSGATFYPLQSIKGFAFEPNFSYRLRVRFVNPNSGMMDDFGYVELAAILEKTPASN